MEAYKMYIYVVNNRRIDMMPPLHSIQPSLFFLMESKGRIFLPHDIEKIITNLIIMIPRDPHVPIVMGYFSGAYFDGKDESNKLNVIKHRLSDWFSECSFFLV